jgi:hypothetical protein
VTAHDGVAGSDAEIVDGGFAGAGPEQRCAVAEVTGAGGDHPDQDGEGADGCAERDPKAAVGDHLFGLGGLGDVEGVPGEKFDKGVFALVPVAFGEGGEALLELREGGFGGSDGPAAGEAAQRKRQPGGCGYGQDQDQSEAGGGDGAVRKGECVGDEDQHQRGDESAAGEDGEAAQQGAPAQTLFQLRNVCVKLFAETHRTSLCIECLDN